MTREVARREIESLDYYLQNHTDDYSEESHTAMMMAISALSAEPCREADDYENEIADLHNRLDIAEYDKERYKEEITTLEAKNKGEWIPVSERLPEIHQDVLLELRSGEMLTGFKAETEPYFYCHGVDGCYVEPQNVLAWQPLPEPYQKGGE